MEKLKNIKINLVYKERKNVIEVRPYVKLKAIKKQIYNLFYPIHSDIDILHNNKSKNSLLDQSVGMIFGNDIIFIELKIRDLPGTKKPCFEKIKKKIIKSPQTNKQIIDNAIHSENVTLPKILSRNQKIPKNIKSIEVKSLVTSRLNNLLYKNDKSSNNNSSIYSKLIQNESENEKSQNWFYNQNRFNKGNSPQRHGKIKLSPIRKEEIYKNSEEQEFAIISKNKA